MQKKFNSIIFDLGGVIYDIDVSCTVKAFKDLGIPNFDQFYTLKKQEQLFDLLETGSIKLEDFYAKLREKNNSITDEQIINCWNALLIGLPQENIQLLRDLKNDYRLFLLSNTNELHLNQINDEMNAQFQLQSLDDLFEKAFYSFKMGLRKPDPAIYEKVLELAGINADEVVFIDDNSDNIAAAESVGITSILKSRDQTLTDFLYEHNLI